MITVIWSFSIGYWFLHSLKQNRQTVEECIAFVDTSPNVIKEKASFLLIRDA